MYRHGERERGRRDAQWCPENVPRRVEEKSERAIGSGETRERERCAATPRSNLYAFINIYIYIHGKKENALPLCFSHFLEKIAFTPHTYTGVLNTMYLVRAWYVQNVYSSLARVGGVHR